MVGTDVRRWHRVDRRLRAYTKAQGGNRGKPVEAVEQAVGVLVDTIDAIRALFHDLDISGFNEPSRAVTLLPRAMNHILQVDPADEDGHNRGVKR